MTKKMTMYRVYSVVDRGPTVLGRARYLGGYCHPFPVSKKQADELGRAEREKPYVAKVEIRPV